MSVGRSRVPQLCGVRLRQGRVLALRADSLQVGPGISIKTSGSFNRGQLPPLAGRPGALPALAVVGSSRGGVRPGGEAPPGSAGGDPGRPPRTPVTPGEPLGSREAALRAQATARRWDARSVGT
jgi:hypothetical protein